MANMADSGSGFGEHITISLERKAAEDLYYALALALDTNVFALERFGKSGKSGGKGR